jgi:hypothetical protein
MSEDGIVRFRSEMDDIYTEQDLIAILDLAEQAADGKPFLLLMLVNEFDFLMTKEARNLFKTYDKAVKLIKAEAVIVKSTPSMILYNLLTKVYPPKFPFKAFTEEAEAVQWLLTNRGKLV